MIERINQKEELIATKIFTVFQASYQVEADLIGVKNFPPLQRTAKDIQGRNTLFFAYKRENDFAGIIEVERPREHLEICSLVIDPAFFRQGIASALLHFVLDTFNPTLAIVETATANHPAIQLYKKFGFEEEQIWTPDHGIQKIKLVRNVV